MSELHIEYTLVPVDEKKKPFQEGMEKRESVALPLFAWVGSPYEQDNIRYIYCQYRHHEPTFRSTTTTNCRVIIFEDQADFDVFQHTGPSLTRGRDIRFPGLYSLVQTIPYTVTTYKGIAGLSLPIALAKKEPIASEVAEAYGKSSDEIKAGLKAFAKEMLETRVEYMTGIVL